MNAGPASWPWRQCTLPGPASPHHAAKTRTAYTVVPFRPRRLAAHTGRHQIQQRGRSGEGFWRHSEKLRRRRRQFTRRPDRFGIGAAQTRALCHCARYSRLLARLGVVLRVCQADGNGQTDTLGDHRKILVAHTFDQLRSPALRQPLCTHSAI